MLRRPLMLLSATGLIAVGAGTAFSGARFTARTPNDGNTLGADRIGNRLHAYSQATNPDSLTGYAVRRGSSPSTPAATGSDEALVVNLGGYDNVNNTAVARVFTLTTPSTLPAGVVSITVSLSLVADPTTGSQPLADYTIATTAGMSLGKSVTMSVGTTRQVNLTVKTRGLTAGRQYVPDVVVQVTYTGYSGGFLAYVVPVKVYDGSGAGPN